MKGNSVTMENSCKWNITVLWERDNVFKKFVIYLQRQEIKYKAVQNFFPFKIPSHSPSYVGTSSDFAVTHCEHESLQFQNKFAYTVYFQWSM
jgi:hypothetical protein